MSESSAELRLKRGDDSPPVSQGRLADFSDDPVVCMRALQAAHGNICALEEDSQRIVFVFGPEWNQRVLSDAKTFHSRFFAVRGPRNSPQRRLTSGLLSMNDAQHREHRRMVMGPFQKRSIAHYHEAICALTGDLLDGWRPGEVRDMHGEMTQYMLRVTSAILFGLDEPELAFKIGEMIDRWVSLNHETGIGAFIADARYVDNYERLLQMAAELEVDVQQMIDLQRSNPNPGHDVLSLLIRAHGEEGRISNEQLIGHVALLFGAAHLTTAHSLTWTLFLLAQHPSVMREVYDEITGTVAADIPTPDEVGQLTLLERVLKESMRVLPASGYSQRICAEPVELGPFKLGRGAPVVFSQFITHHLPELFPDPEVFKPERWLEIAPSPYAYLPFGAGPRMCLGGPLAMMTLKTALPMILKRYRLGVVPNSEINGKIVSTMLGPTTSVPMLVSPPDGRFQSAAVTGNIHTMVDLREAPAVQRKAA